MTEQHYTHTTIQTPAGEVNIHQVHVNQTIPNQNEEIIDVESNYTSNNRGMLPVDPKDMPSTYALPIADEEDPVAIPVPSPATADSKLPPAPMSDGTIKLDARVEPEKVSVSGDSIKLAPVPAPDNAIVASQTMPTSTDIVPNNYADVEVIEPTVPHVEQPIALPDNHLMNVKGEQVNLGNVGFMATTVGKVEIV